MRWGLVPYWADDVKIGNRLINARAETIERAPAFREAYQRRRCLVPADGFFEWRKAGKTRQPLLVRRRDQAPFAFAGLWERWRQPDGQVLRSCTIVTCPANALVAPVHDRMPVILGPGDYERWLDPAGGRRASCCGPARPTGWRRSRSARGSTARPTTIPNASHRRGAGGRAAQPALSAIALAANSPHRLPCRMAVSNPRMEGVEGCLSRSRSAAIEATP